MKLKKAVALCCAFVVGLSSIQGVSAYTSHNVITKSNQRIQQIKKLMSINQLNSLREWTNPVFDSASVLKKMQKGKRYKLSFTMTMDKVYSHYVPNNMTVSNYMRKGIALYSIKLGKDFAGLPTWNNQTLTTKEMKNGDKVYMEGVFTATEELLNPNNEYLFVFYTEMKGNADGSWGPSTLSTMSFKDIKLIQLN